MDLHEAADSSADRDRMKENSLHEEDLYHLPGPFILTVLADTSSSWCREVDKGIRACE